MASGDIITNIADKETLDACYAILKGLKDSTTDGSVTKSELENADASASDVLSGKKFYSKNNKLKTGTIPVKSAATYTASREDQIIPAGRYLSGDQKIASVTQSGLLAENILEGATISVGSNGTNLWNVTGKVVPNTSTIVACLFGFGWGYGEMKPIWHIMNSKSAESNKDANGRSVLTLYPGTYTFVAGRINNGGEEGKADSDGHYEWLHINGVKWNIAHSGRGEEADGTLTPPSITTRTFTSNATVTQFIGSSHEDGNGANCIVCFIFKGNIFG